VQREEGVLTRWNPDYRSASLGYCLDDGSARSSQSAIGHQNVGGDRQTPIA
jgi:hypothetical protein